MQHRLWIATPVVLYLLYLTALFAMQRRVIFAGWGSPAANVPIAAPWERGELTLSGGVTVPTLLGLPEGPGPHPAVMFAHGNAEVIDNWPSRLEPYLERGMAVYLVEYPGYNGASGAPTERSIREAMVTGYDTVTADPRIEQVMFGHGRSLGGGAISGLATERGLRGIILESTFYSLRSLAWRMGAPPFLVRDPMATGRYLQGWRGPILILHGTEDEVVPYAQSERMVRMFPQAERVTRRCGHNDCPMDETYWDAIQRMLDHDALPGTGTPASP